MATPRNHIELRDSSPGSVPHVVNTVFIDGVEVLLEKNGVDITFSEDDPTVVALRVLPHRISFN